MRDSYLMTLTLFQSMALGFNGLDALVNVLRDKSSRQILLLITHASTLWFGLSTPTPNTPGTYQILSKKTYQDDWLSPSTQEGERAFGRNSFLQASHQTSRSPPRIVQRFLISKNKGLLARSKDSSKEVFSIGWVCMIHCLILRRFLTRAVRLKS